MESFFGLSVCFSISCFYFYFLTELHFLGQLSLSPEMLSVSFVNVSVSVDTKRSSRT